MTRYADDQIDLIQDKASMSLRQWSGRFRLRDLMTQALARHGFKPALNRASPGIARAAARAALPGS